MVDIAALNSHVKFDRTDLPFDQRKILGDATETGLIRFAGNISQTMTVLFLPQGRRGGPITNDFRTKYDEAYDYMASRGHRVITCAQKLLPSDVYDPEYEFSKTDAKYPSSEYCFCGLISLEDPPKHGVREAIGTLRLAGIKHSGCGKNGIRAIRVGSHPKTAEAIARKINLILGETKETLSKKTGRPVEDIYEDEVDAVVIHGTRTPTHSRSCKSMQR
ncbi:hypothetical protein BN946_scf184675.g7 [Trametes cinnabarina]|uniref:Uncharacterized protein n=1 Tax=Pycnoporus cinnabarinus TaxID=5643 RepID=A0A060SS12_PYCCI|nr:hypothetical protein BN946_scf184675.g7 [Trametes cinnabarina]